MSEPVTIIGSHCDIYLYFMAARISQALLCLLVAEAKPGKMAGIGLIPETDTDRICCDVEGIPE